MKTDTKLKLNKTLNILHRLHIKDEDVMLVGSVALDMQGLLPENREVHDIDLIIRMDDEAWKGFKFLETVLGKTNDYPDIRNVIIDLDDVVLNIWRAKGEETLSGLKYEGLNVKPAGEILKVKKSYGRTKDLQDIASICKELL